MLFGSKTIYRQQSKPSMEISSPVITVPRNGKLGWYEKFKHHIFLLEESAAKVILIGDSLISNLSRYPDVLVSRNPGSLESRVTRFKTYHGY